jgi:cytidyltransferase-like protein
MKSFLELVEEKESENKPVVMAFGRMNPPTTGHLKLIDKVKHEAEKQKAKHVVVVSHSQDSKKNPLSGEQKVKHLKRYSPGTHFETSDKEHPTILHHAAKLHAKGHDKLTVIAGSDRVKEMHDLLHKYNGVKGRHGHYNFKKIEVKSAGHRDPDAEGSEGMSGTKMREHAKNKDFHSFRQGVPHHVSDVHAKELMHDVRKGMGLHESTNHGQFKAIFVTGGPGSGKDVVIREAIAESKIVELNFIQARDYLADKQKLSEKTNDFRREAIRARGPLIINGPADDIEKISYIKEELEELGYDAMMIFVYTTNETSQERNSLLARMMAESVRYDKWVKSQQNITQFSEMYNNLVTFDNTGNLDTKEEDITNIYQSTKEFLDSRATNESATDWLNRNVSLFGEDNVKKNSKSIQQKTIGRYNNFFRAKSPADIKPDNSGSLVGSRDQIKGGTGPRKDPNGQGHSGGAWHGAYNEAAPTLKISNPPKEPNFQKDNDKNKKLKRGDKSLSVGRVGRPDGVSGEYDTRAGGQGAAAGAGLGQNLYGETQEYSNASQNGTAMLGSKVEPNPLSEKKKKKLTFKEFNGFQNDGESGLGGVLGGASNKEGMDTYKDPNRNIGIQIVKKKKKKFNENHVSELETGLKKLDSHSYDSIDRLMQNIASKYGITGKNLHDDFKKKHDKIPDKWIKDKK